jgi:protease-4
MVTMVRRQPPLLLELDLTQPLVEVEPEDPISKLRSRGKPRLAAVLRMLREAGDDPRVGGLVAKLGGSTMELAIVEEIRGAVQAFAASGKPTVAWSETHGEDGNGTPSYYLATGFSEIWVQPSGTVNLLGLSAEVTFLRGALDKIGVEPQIGQRYEYKSAADRITKREFTDAHRESIERLVVSSWDTILAEVASARGLSQVQVRELADRAPLTASAAQEARLIDRVGYRDEVYDNVRRRAGGDVRLLFGNRWKPKKALPAKAAAAVTNRNQPVIALVEGHGAIVMGRSRRSAMNGQQMGSDTIAAAIRAARTDDKVRALVFRVDSPGGSAIASDTVWREVALVRDAGKPVIVSMGALAASGGYFVACPADVIVAQPTTITGSIGVLGGKPVITGLLNKVGLGTGIASRGERAQLFSLRSPFSKDERERLEQMLDEIYLDFTTKVAQGRGMTREAVHEVAKGRVWTGADAAERGLVDRLGGLHDAVGIARERTGLDEKAPVRKAVQVGTLQKLRSPRSSDDPRAVTAATSLAGWGELAGIAAALGLPAAGPLMMPNIRLT